MPGVLSIFQKVPISPHFHRNKVTNGVRVQHTSLVKRCKSDKGPPDVEYQYLMRSILPTTHFQDSLPHLPIPKLDETCKRYLWAQKPLLDADAYKQTSLYVEKFLKNEGAQCQTILIHEDKKNTHTSYISKPWFDMYLSDRSPLPINVNPFLVFTKNHDESYNDQLVRASNLVISSLRFLKSLQDEILEPEVFYLNPEKSRSVSFKVITGLLPRSISWYGAYMLKAFPLDMSQYPSLFNSTRIPLIGKDAIKRFDGKKHLLVMKGGHFYTFDVIDSDGYIETPDVIVSGIKSILTSSEPVAKHPVGILTTENRNTWAAARNHLVTLGNTEVLDLIDSSLFILVLDDKNPGDNPVSLIRLFLHADGTNRWFDKSFSLIVTRDGHAGLNFEHSWGDGVAVLRYFNDIHRDSTKTPRVHDDTLGNNTTVSIRKLEFNLDDKMKGLIDDARKKYDSVCNSLDVRVMEYTKFGRQLCKQQNISPDAMMQLAFQMAYNKLKGKPVATYESCSTAAFKHGRTETVRPCTVDTQELCQTLWQKTTPASKEQLQQMIQKCSATHSQLIKEAAMGRGFDRHLFALKLKCEEMGLKPALFEDPAYKAINHYVLSTSTLNSDALYMGAFGPVVADGFGIGYSIWNERLGSIVTSYRGNADGEGFLKALQHSLDKLDLILKP